MTTTLSSKDKKLLLYVGGAAVFFLVLFLIFMPTNEKTSVLKDENATLLSEVEHLRALDADKETYLAKTDETNRAIVETLSHFPVAVLEEETIMYAVELEDKNDMVINSISISPEELLYTSSIPVASPAYKGNPEDAASAVVPLNLYNTNAIYSFTSSYEGFKEIYTMIQKDNHLKNVDSLSMAYDQESGMIIGTMSVNLFAVDGTGEAYVSPEIRDVKTGVLNVFGTAAPIKETAAGE